MYLRSTIEGRKSINRKMQLNEEVEARKGGSKTQKSIGSVSTETSVKALKKTWCFLFLELSYLLNISPHRQAAGDGLRNLPVIFAVI
jgi:hypothetical protein